MKTAMAGFSCRLPRCSTGRAPYESAIAAGSPEATAPATARTAGLGATELDGRVVGRRRGVRAHDVGLDRGGTIVPDLAGVRAGGHDVVGPELVPVPVEAAGAGRGGRVLAVGGNENVAGLVHEGVHEFGVG